MILDCLNTYPHAKIGFFASDMKLYIDSDAAYPVAPKAKSSIAGFYYLSNTTNPKLNDPILVEYRLLKRGVTSAAESETAGLFYNTQTAVDIKNILMALGHQHTDVPIKTDNSTAASFVTDTLKQKRSKAWDVHYHWLSEQQKLGNFKIFWDKGIKNFAEHHTKHHSPTHHQNVRKNYI